MDVFPPFFLPTPFFDKELTHHPDLHMSQSFASLIPRLGIEAGDGEIYVAELFDMFLKNSTRFYI